jgi:hypothetical protein
MEHLHLLEHLLDAAVRLIPFVVTSLFKKI